MTDNPLKGAEVAVEVEVGTGEDGTMFVALVLDDYLIGLSPRDARALCEDIVDCIKEIEFETHGGKGEN